MAPDTARRWYDIVDWTIIVVCVAYLVRVARIVGSGRGC